VPLMLVVTGLHVRAVGSWSCSTGAARDMSAEAPTGISMQACALHTQPSILHADAFGRLASQTQQWHGIVAEVVDIAILGGHVPRTCC